MTPPHETTQVTVNGKEIYCMAKIIGNDHFRYFVSHYEFPFCSVDKPDESGHYTARTYRGLKQLGHDFTHEEVVKWALGVLETESPDYHKKITQG